VKFASLAHLNRLGSAALDRGVVPHNVTDGFTGSVPRSRSFGTRTVSATLWASVVKSVKRH